MLRIHPFAVLNFLPFDMHWYNFPYFTEVWDRLGFVPVAKAYNMTYADNPRANIIRRDSPNVVGIFNFMLYEYSILIVKDIQSMQFLIRYNDWQHDPLQEGSPGWGVCSRNDLPVYNCTLCSPSCFGGLDAKVTSYSDPTMYPPFHSIRNVPLDAVTGLLSADPLIRCRHHLTGLRALYARM